RNGPCWVQVDPERVSTATLPPLSSPKGALISAVLPSSDSATLVPKPSPGQLARFSPRVQVDPERVNTHAPISPLVPISAVFPSPDSATAVPNRSPSPAHAMPSVSFEPC